MISPQHIISLSLQEPPVFVHFKTQVQSLNNFLCIFSM